MTPSQAWLRACGPRPPAGAEEFAARVHRLMQENDFAFAGPQPCEPGLRIDAGPAGPGARHYVHVACFGQAADAWWVVEVGSEAARMGDLQALVDAVPGEQALAGRLLPALLATGEFRLAGT